MLLCFVFVLYGKILNLRASQSIFDTVVYTFVPHTNYKYYDITLEKHSKTISARIHEIPTPKDSYWFDTEVILRSDNLLKLFERIKKKIDVIEFQILNMCSLLKNLFHKDGSIAFFNGSNNANIKIIQKINKLYKDIKPKRLTNIKNGIAVYDKHKLKIFFDITKPSSRLLNQNLHSGTLSFEMSYDNEKIFTNCGSIEKRIGKKPEFLRFSAAHTTLILNNTNISELVEKKSYKRIPQLIKYNYEELDDAFLYESIHDGYSKNFKSVIKRKMLISKKNIGINGEDTIISTKLSSRKKIYNIRFHLTPNCSCLITNNEKNVLIKTNLNNSWIFKSENKLTLEDSIYINDGKRISKTKQIVISGVVSSPKKTETWSIYKT